MKNRQNGPKGTIRERMKRAADSLKERAKNMNEETQVNQEQLENEQQTENVVVDVETLTKELEETKAQRDEYLDLVQRKQAEFANYRRRTESVRSEAYDDGRRDAIDKLLPVVDNLERALAAAGEESSLKSGVEMVLRQTLDILTKMGVETIDPMGQPFDAELHNAVMQGGEDEGEPGTVCMVFQKGFKMGDKVVRFAMVQVAN